MIKKVIRSDVLSGVSSPLLPLIYADFEFNNGGNDGVYLQTDDNNDFATVFSLRNGCATLMHLNENIDFEELSEFFSFLSVKECLSDKDVFVKRGETLPLLKCDIKGDMNATVSKLDKYSRLEDYKAVYDLLSDNGDNFPEWFAVTSKKINSEKAVCVYICENNALVSVAIATAIYNGDAIISGVFTREDYRNKGYASKCVSSILGELNHVGIKSAYLWCEEHNLPFYKKIGFVQIGNVVREDF